MDELAVVEPHGPDRIVATTTRRRSQRARRGDGPDARRRQRRARTCSCAAAACSRSSRPCPKARASGCAAAATDRSSCRSAPTTSLTDSWNRTVLQWQRSAPSSLVCITRAGLTVVGRPRADHGLRRAVAWLGAALIAAIAPHALLAWADHRKLPASARGRCSSSAARSCSRSYAVEPHTTGSGIPTSETFSSYFHELGDAPHVLRTAVVPVVGNGQRAAARARRAVDRRRDRGVVGAAASTRHSARSARASCCSSRSPRSARAAGCCTTIVYALAGRAVPRRVAPDGDDRTAELVPHREPAPVAGAAGRRPRRASRSCSPPRSSHRCCPGRAATPWFDYRSLGDGSGGGLLKATTPIVSIQAKLLEDPEHEVFTVDIGDAPPVYWRVIALDKYDGKLWTLEDTGEPAEGPHAPRPSRASATSWCRSSTSATSDPHWLPAAYHPVEINLENALRRRRTRRRCT